MSTELEKYFDPTEYEVGGFFQSTNHSMWEAAERLRLSPEERIGLRQYPPYVELKNGAPEIYADPRRRAWITFNVYAHAAARYTTIPGCSRSKPAVLLWRK